MNLNELHHLVARAARLAYRPTRIAINPRTIARHFPGLSFVLGIPVYPSPLVPEDEAYVLSDSARWPPMDPRYAPPARDETHGMTLDELLGKADAQHTAIEEQLG